jgi:hypothetical protein
MKIPMEIPEAVGDATKEIIEFEAEAAVVSSESFVFLCLA